MLQTTGNRSNKMITNFTSQNGEKDLLQVGMLTKEIYFRQIFF